VAGELTRLLLATLLLRITRLASDKQSNTVVLCSPTYRQFRRELEESFADIHTTNEYAYRLGYSSRTLNRACIKESGHTAKELIDTRIILEAKRLLTYTHLPIATIAGTWVSVKPPTLANTLPE
jgi:AraC-like DNA-binding protein